MVESQPSKLLVASSSLVSRSIFRPYTLIVTSVSVLICLSLLAQTGCIERKPERLARRESPVSSELSRLTNTTLEAYQDSTLSEAQLVLIEERNRRVVFTFLAQALIEEADDLYAASWLLNSSHAPVGRDDFLMGHYLALEAYRKGHPDAWELAQLHLQRFLVASGVSPDRASALAGTAEDTSAVMPHGEISGRELPLDWLDSLFDSLAAARLK